VVDVVDRPGYVDELGHVDVTKLERIDAQVLNVLQRAGVEVVEKQTQQAPWAKSTAPMVRTRILRSSVNDQVSM
jgi:hypothetical protein